VPKPAVDRYRYGRTVGSIIGYARVSTSELSTEAQESELTAYEAVRGFAGRGESSRRADQPQWLARLDHLRAGDTLVIRKRNRIADREIMAIQTIAELHDRGGQIKSLTEPDIDTTTPMGRALFGFVAVDAHLPVDMIRENSQRGLAHARTQGRLRGPPSVMTLPGACPRPPRCVQSSKASRRSRGCLGSEHLQSAAPYPRPTANTQSCSHVGSRRSSGQKSL
jgi:DNA invertase Pin-like site-specific DNA recombinase